MQTTVRTIKCITLHEPYATLIALRAKTYETRSWATRYRGPLAIHAGRNTFMVEDLRRTYMQHRTAGTKPPAGTLLAVLLDALKSYQDIPLTSAIFDEMPLGCIVAVADLTNILPTNSIVGRLTPKERACGNFAPGRYAWQMSNVRMLRKPYPIRGQQGLWDVTLPAALIEEVGL
jgi:hypothetical protein